MILLLLNKVFTVLFFLALLSSLRHGYYFIQSLIKSTEEVPVRYVLNNKTLLLLGVSIAYVLGAIITGIKL